MTEQGIIDCISALKTNYGGFNYTTNEFASLVKLWDIQFKDLDDSTVSSSVMRLIASSEHRPNIAMIKKDIAEEYVSERDDFEVWDIVLSSSRNDINYAYDEWCLLPEDIKKAVTPQMLYEIGRSDENSSQFYRKEVLNSYHSLIGRKRNNVMLSFQNGHSIGYEDHDQDLLPYDSNKSEESTDISNEHPLPFY